VGDDPASQVYVRNKALACEALGMHSEVHALSAETTQAHLIAFVQRLNADPTSTASWCSCRCRSTSTRAP
jgi:methylenetetrahydrofolate dehydrogenase (NADP+)/methenyltetrahydrofolate cyclohydrolase